MLRARVAAVCVDLDQHLGGIGDARSRCYISVCRCTLYYRIGNIRAFGFVGVGTYSRMDWREPNVSALSAQIFKKKGNRHNYFFPDQNRFRYGSRVL